MVTADDNSSATDAPLPRHTRWLRAAGWLLVVILIVVGATLEYTALSAWENSKHYMPDRSYAVRAAAGGIACLVAAVLVLRFLRLGTVRPAPVAILQSVIAVALGPVLFIPIYVVMLLVIMLIVAIQNVPW